MRPGERRDRRRDARGRGGWLDSAAALRAGALARPAFGAAPDAAGGANTTIAVVATDAPLDGSAAYRVAQNAHDALARAIRPCHTPFDGDTVFALSTAPGPSDPATLAMLCAAAEHVLARAILRAVTSDERRPRRCDE